MLLGCWCYWFYLTVLEAQHAAIRLLSALHCVSAEMFLAVGPSLIHSSPYSHGSDCYLIAAIYVMLLLQFAQNFGRRGNLAGQGATSAGLGATAPGLGAAPAPAAAAAADNNGATAPRGRARRVSGGRWGSCCRV